MKLSVSGFEVSEKDLQDQQREYSPQAHPEPASTISGSATTFLTISYARHPIYTSYTWEHALVSKAIERFSACPNLEVLGSEDADRLSIISLRFKHGDKDLHYGFVVSLLNDLFGIQVRGGCSCAGPYGHALLDMDMDMSRAIKAEILKGSTILRPGWVIWAPADAVTSRLRARKLHASPDDYPMKIALRCPLRTISDRGL